MIDRRLTSILAGVLLSFGLSGSWEGAMAAEPGVISVTGTGRVSAKPDMASVQIGVVTQDSSAQEATKRNNEAMAALLKLALDQGIDQKHMQTAGFDVQPEYRHDERGQLPPKVVGYRVSNRVHIKIVQLDKLGIILDKLIASGSNEISGITFGIQQRDGLTDQARKLAMADARRKAQLYAETADVPLGKVHAIREQANFGGPQPMPYARMAAMEASAVPIAAGELEIEVSVNVDYEIGSAQ